MSVPLLSGLSPVFYRTSLCEKTEEKSGKNLMFASLYRCARPTGKPYEGVTIIQINLFCNMLYSMRYCTYIRLVEESLTFSKFLNCVTALEYLFSGSKSKELQGQLCAPPAPCAETHIPGVEVWAFPIVFSECLV